MLKENKIVYLLICIYLAFTGCEKEIPFKEETQTPRLVIYAKFPISDSIYVHAGRSRGIAEERDVKKISDASIKIFDGSNVVANFKFVKLGYYESSIPFKPKTGVSYKLEASAPNLEPVYSFETIPSPIDFIVSTTLTSKGKTGKNLNFNITISDPIISSNYYSLKIYRIDSIYINDVLTEIKTVPIKCSSNDQSIENLNGSEITEEIDPPSTLYIRDDLFNGKAYTLKVTDRWAYSSNSNYPKTFIIELNTLSEAYFNHTISQVKYIQAEQIPFSQPVQIFSNIENGIGIFAGYSKKQKRVVARL